MVLEIPLSKNGKHAGKYLALVSDEDADLTELNWTVVIAETHTKVMYAVRRPTVGHKRVNTKLHRVILERVLGRELLKDEFVDHINMNGLDNRRENLRLATHQQNLANRTMTKQNKTGYKGVSKKKNRFVAQIHINGRNKTIGYFKTPEEAHEAYCKKAKEIYGEFWSAG